MTSPTRPTQILHLLLAMGETSAPYNEHCLPAAASGNVAICTFFKPTVVPLDGLSLFAGDGTIPGFFRALFQAIKSRRFDIVHAHSVHVASMYTLARPFLQKSRRPRTVYTLHSSYPNYKLTNRLMLIFTILFFHRIVCCSQASLDSLPGWIRRLGKGRLSVVPNGIDLARVDRVRIFHQAETDDCIFTIISIGRLIPVKNPLVLLQAFSCNPHTDRRLVFVGEGNLRPEMIKAARAAQVENRVVLTGLVPRETVYSHLLSAHLFVSTSRIEGLPVAVLEAMACGLPIILSDIPSHREIAAGTDFIPLLATDDVSGFASKIEKFARLTSSERLAIGKKCRDRVEAHFSLDAMRAGYQAIYDEVSQ